MLLAPRAGAQAAGSSDAELEAHRVRLDKTLVVLAEHGAPSPIAASFQVLLGGIYIAAGVYVGVDGGGMGDGDGRALASTASLTLGSIWMAGGIHGFFRTTTDQDRLVRFRRARTAGLLDATALAQIEGELAAEAAVTRYHRHIEGAQSIGMAAGGAGIIAVAIAADGMEGASRVMAGTIGGVFVAFGTWMAIDKLTSESAYERIIAEHRKPSVSVAPVVSAGVMGLSASGTF